MKTAGQKPKPDNPEAMTTSLGYIVGLPDDPEAPLAKGKFEKTVEGLKRVYPTMTEARATVKVSSPLGERKRFEVQVMIRMPGHQFEFADEGWSLAETFDKITGKMKRLRTKPEKKPSYRKTPARSESSGTLIEEV